MKKLILFFAVFFNCIYLGHSEGGPVNVANRFNFTATNNSGDANKVRDLNKSTAWKTTTKGVAESITGIAATAQNIRTIRLRMLTGPNYADYQKLEIWVTANGSNWTLFRRDGGSTGFYNCNGSNIGACTAAFVTTSDVNGTIPIKGIKVTVFEHKDQNGVIQPINFSEIELE